MTHFGIIPVAHLYISHGVRIEILSSVIMMQHLACGILVHLSVWIVQTVCTEKGLVEFGNTMTYNSTDGVQYTYTYVFVDNKFDWYIVLFEFVQKHDSTCFIVYSIGDYHQQDDERQFCTVASYIPPAWSAIFSDVESESAAVVPTKQFVLGQRRGTQGGTYNRYCSSRNTKMCHVVVSLYQSSLVACSL